MNDKYLSGSKKDVRDYGRRPAGPELPEYVTSQSGTNGGGGGRSGRRSTDKTSRGPSEHRATVAADGDYVRTAYGRNWLGAQIARVVPSGNDIVILALWQVGEIDAIEELRVNDAALPAGASATHYLGTAGQGVDPILAALIDGYADTMIATVYGQTVRVAYSVITVPIGKLSGFPRIEALVRGVKVYDPRTEVTAYSSNPALHLADFITSTAYGAGWPLDWDSVSDAADECDATVGTPAEPRRTAGTILDRVARVEDWIETLRTYAGCLVVRAGDTVRLVPDRPTASSRSLTGAHIKGLRLALKGQADSPSVVRVRYTDTTVVPWREGEAVAKLSGVDLGTVPRVETVIQLQGIQRYSQAYREAIERLNWYHLVDLRAECETFDASLATLAGDVVTITHPIGLTAKQFRVLAADQSAPGRWRWRLEEYDPAVYSDAVVESPSVGDTSLPSPLDVPDLTGLNADEEVYQLQTGVYSTRLRVTWDASTWLYLSDYLVEVWAGATRVWTLSTPNNEAVAGPVQEGVAYTVKAAIRSNLATGDFAEYAITAQGKQLPPGDVPQITAAQSGADVVDATWLAAVDVDVWRYDLRVGPVGVAWADATRVDLIDGLRAPITGLALGAYHLLVKCVDSVKNPSANEARCSVTVSPPTAPASLNGFEVGGKVRLEWPAGSGFVAGYEIRYGAVGGTWGAARRIDRLHALRLQSDTVPAGTWVFYVRSYDAAGNYSTGEATKTLAVTLDNDAYLVDTHEHAAGTLTRVATWTHRPEGDAITYAVTETGQSIADRWPLPMVNYTEPLAAHHDAQTSEWLSDVWDAGLMLTGNWTMELNGGGIYAIGSGAVESFLELAVESGGPWQQYSAGAAKASARYARVRVTAATDGTLQVTSATVRADAIPREETGRVTTLAGGGKRIFLSNSYFAIKTLTLTPVGSAPCTLAPDAIKLASGADGAALLYEVTIGSGGGTKYSYWRMATNARLIQADDYLEYDVQLMPGVASLAGIGGIEIDFTDLTALRQLGSADSYGASQFPTIPADGAWHSRKLPLVNAAGKTSSSFDFVTISNVAGQFDALYRNVRVTDGAGTIRLQIWESGETSANANAYSSGATAVSLAPANSFMIYAFDSAWTQIAKDTLWTFKGV